MSEVHCVQEQRRQYDFDLTMCPLKISSFHFDQAILSYVNPAISYCNADPRLVRKIFRLSNTLATSSVCTGSEQLFCPVSEFKTNCSQYDGYS